MARYLHPKRKISVEKEDGRIGCASFGLVGYATGQLVWGVGHQHRGCLLYTSPSPRDS